MTEKKGQRLCSECKWPLVTYFVQQLPSGPIRWSAEVHKTGCSVGLASLKAVLKRHDADVARIEAWFAEAAKPHRRPPAAIKKKYADDLLEAAQRIRPILFQDPGPTDNG